jgi:hypothetical protein
MQEPREVGGQRPRVPPFPSGILLAGRRQVSRADFTAWMPYFASLL